MKPLSLNLTLAVLIAAPLCAAPIPPATATAGLQGPWGGKTGGLQVRLKIAGEIRMQKPLHVTAELKNVSGEKLPENNFRLWVMVAREDGAIFYTAPYAGLPKALDADATAEFTFDAGNLAAFQFTKDLELHDGLPAPADAKAAPPKSTGKLSDILHAGNAKARIFVVMTPGPADKKTAENQTVVAVSGTLAMNVADVGGGNVSQMDPAQKKAFFAELGAGFHGDAVAGKNAHDRAVKAGEGVAPELVKLLEDKKLSEPGQMWLAATLVDLKDAHAVDALIKISEKGGNAAYVVAYKGPAMKDAKLTAAIEKAAATTTDGTLTAWAVRGLGIDGDRVDGSLLESMLAHSDPAGRIEAAGILAAHPDPRAVPLLAKLITDENAGVRLAAIRAALAHAKKNPEILAALDKAASMMDTDNIKAADAAKSARKQLGR